MSNTTGFTPLFSNDDIDRWFDIFKEEAEEKIVILLQAAGEMFVKYARELHTYEDQTGNLRSSIGYVVCKDGESITENFQQSDKGTDKTTGNYKGKQLAETIASSYHSGYVLVGVAGMQYAAAVEAKGYDVVTGACSQAESWLKKSIQSVFKQHNNG
jgi:hypothetical protein